LDIEEHFDLNEEIIFIARVSYMDEARMKKHDLPSKNKLK
jgi:hypothetical protein